VSPSSKKPADPAVRSDPRLTRRTRGPSRPQSDLSRRAELEQRLGVRFQGVGLLELALTHRSLANETPSAAGTGDNERLEFLGDAVLGLVVADHLYRIFPEAAEGALTVMRADLVRRSSLAAWARELGLGGHLILGKGEDRAGGRNRDAVLASCFEAVVGALYLDRGESAVRAFVEPLVTEALPRLSPSGRSADAKSELQRRVQSATGHLPLYEVTGVEGPEHQPRFTVRVAVSGIPELGAEGQGSTKQGAEQLAAQRLLDSWTDELAATNGAAE
jgi:ribonuclease III